MEERRKHIRINKGFTITYSVKKAYLRFGTRNANISEGGIRLPIQHKLESGTVLEMEISSSELKERINAVAVVVWVKPCDSIRAPFEIGLKFIEIKPDDLEAIRRIINNLLKDKDSPYMKWLT
jgi:c-di-GMP-binding flagellar brake protein YcgR